MISICKTPHEYSQKYTFGLHTHTHTYSTIFKQIYVGKKKRVNNSISYDKVTLTIHIKCLKYLVYLSFISFIYTHHTLVSANDKAYSHSIATPMYVLYIKILYLLFDCCINKYFSLLSYIRSSQNGENGKMKAHKCSGTKTEYQFKSKFYA